MKTILILVLAGALAGALAFTRPTEADFKSYVMSRAAEGDLSELTAFLGSTSYQSYVLWSVVRRDGKTLYIGALSHWFAREDFPGKWEIHKSPRAT